MQLAQQDARAQQVLQHQKMFVETRLAQQEAAYDAMLERMKMEMQSQAQARDQARRDAESDARVRTFRAGGQLNK
jgi:hypothetical protein